MTSTKRESREPHTFLTIKSAEGRLSTVSHRISKAQVDAALSTVKRARTKSGRTQRSGEDRAATPEVQPLA